MGRLTDQVVEDTRHDVAGVLANSSDALFLRSPEARDEPATVFEGEAVEVVGQGRQVTAAECR